MVEILHYENANKNKTIGYVDIRVPIAKPTVLIFRKIAHLQSGDRRWFNLPSFSRDLESGAPNYHRYCEFETQVNNMSLLEGLTDKVKEFCKKNGIEAVQPLDFDTFPENLEELPF